MKHHKPSSKFIRIVVTGVFLHLFVGCAPNNLPLPGGSWPDALVTHSVVSNASLDQVWSHSGVRARQDNFGSLIVASQGSVFVLGSLDPRGSERVQAFNASDGNLIWSGGPGIALHATSSTLYVGHVGIGTVDAYDLRQVGSFGQQVYHVLAVSYIFMRLATKCTSTQVMRFFIS